MSAPAEPDRPNPRTAPGGPLGRPWLAAIALMNAVTGLAAAMVLAPLSFGLDADAFRRGAIAVAEGRMDKDFLYAPLAGLLARPLTLMPSTTAGLVMAGIGLAILLAGVLLETRGLAAVDRLLLAIAVAGFAPVVNELLLGQVTLLVTAALLPAVRGSDRVRNGIPLGIALALAPKPVLLPVLAWVLLRRRRSFAGVAAAALVTTLVGLIVMGADLYGLWVDVLAATGRVARSGNRSLWTGGLEPIAAVVAVLVTAGAAWAIARDEERGLVASLFAGLLLAPYTLVYSASVLLLAIRPSLRFAPLQTRVLALFSNPAVVFAFVPWALLALLGCLPAGSRWKALQQRLRGRPFSVRPHGT